MSWLVLALLVVFVVRMWLSMVTRRRRRASVEARVPAQRTPPTSVGARVPAQRTPPTSMERPAPVGLEPSEEIAASVGEVPGPVTQEVAASVGDVAGPVTQEVAASVGDVAGPVTQEVAASVGDVAEPGTHTSGPAVDVDAELEGRVQALMSSGFEAGAVRLLCDELGIGIHDAQQTVRALAGHARADAASQDSANR